MLKYTDISSQLIASGGGVRTQFSLRSGHWEFDYAPVNIWATQIRCGEVFWGGHKGQRVDLGGMVSKCDQNKLYVIPK